MTIEVLDPTYGDGAPAFTPAPRLATLEGATVGIVSNAKKGTADFFESLAAALRRDHGVAEVVVTSKSNYSAPADDDIIDRVGEWHALVAGVGD